MTNICIIATIIIYLVAMLLVGFAYSKSNNDSTDFYLGGRKMGPLVTAMSAEASDMSSWLLMGMPGLAYLTGIASPGWTAIGLALGTWLNWLIVARRLRRYSANLEAITVPQFLSLRFHDQRNLLNALGAVIIIVFFVPYTASGFAACGKLFHSLFGVDYMAAMVVSACVIVGYTITGGFRAVTTTDLIQSIVMSLALVAVLVYGIGAAGGCGVPTIKPWNIEAVQEKLDILNKTNIFAVAMDIDGAGLPFLKALNPNAGSKPVEELQQIIQYTDKPFILKGIMTVKGAEKAVAAGAKAIVVSNHGGRVLGSCPGTAEVLPEIVDAVGKDVTILVDGGIRSGTDIFRALAVGADAVLIGRPFVPAVYGGGKEGVRLLVEKLAAELKDTMTMCGAHSLEEISRDMIRFAK